MIVSQFGDGLNDSDKTTVVIRDVELSDHSEIVLEKLGPGLRDGVGLTLEEAAQLVTELSRYLDSRNLEGGLN